MLICLHFRHFKQNPNSSLKQKSKIISRSNVKQSLKVTLSLYLTKTYAMKTYGGEDV
jgi:hypothetical protein